jgi:hypothetical protein
MMMMLRRSPGTRLFAAAFAPWLALVMAEPVALHECAMHSGHGVQATTTAMAHQHGTGAHADTVPAHTPSRDAAANYCTCLGGCCAAAAVALPGAVELSFAPASVRAERCAEPCEQAVPAAGEHLLPFANGPPAARV